MPQITRIVKEIAECGNTDFTYLSRVWIWDSFCPRLHGMLKRLRNAEKILDCELGIAEGGFGVVKQYSAAERIKLSFKNNLNMDGCDFFQVLFF